MRAEWEVEANPDGTFDVRQNRRAVAYDLDDYEVAPLLRRYRVTEYISVEPDGYRTIVRLR